MGLKLSGLIPSAPVTAADLRGKVVAIDAPNLMYGFFAVQTQGTVTPTQREAARRSSTVGTLERVAALAAIGARSVLVLDGPPHDAKKALLARRDAARRGQALLPDDYAPLAQLGRALGLPVVQAPHDAEGQASAMATRGQVDIVATTDWDALAMGAPALLRHLASRERWTLVRSREALDALSASRATLAAMSALMGCDYCEGLPGVGPKKALRLLAGSTGPDPLGEALQRADVDEETRDACLAAYALLLDPPHARVPKPTWRLPDAAALADACAGAGVLPERLERVARGLREAHATRARQARLAL